MNSSAPRIIALDKTKLNMLLIATLIFVVLGFVLVFAAPFFPRVTYGSRIFLSCVGMCSIAFFGLGSIFFFKKVFDNSPGLIISSDGFTDNSSGVSVGFTPWSDIIEMREQTVVSQIFLLVIVKNPESYISRQSGMFKRFMMRMNHKFYGTPISISANTLKIEFYEMVKLFQENLHNSRMYEL